MCDVPTARAVVEDAVTLATYAMIDMRTENFVRRLHILLLEMNKRRHQSCA